jgi:hypothetical protein
VDAAHRVVADDDEREGGRRPQVDRGGPRLGDGEVARDGEGRRDVGGGRADGGRIGETVQGDGGDREQDREQRGRPGDLEQREGRAHGDAAVVSRRHGPNVGRVAPAVVPPRRRAARTRAGPPGPSPHLHQRSPTP